MKQGVFITFEGNDGAGKTTVCLKIKEELEKRGYPVLYTREPGGSKIAEQKAYDRGYNKGRKQALKETEKKLEEVTEEPKNEIALIPEEFMDDLRANGKAVWRRCR